MKKKNKLILIIALIAAIVIAGVWIAVALFGPGHDHSFGEWKTQTPANCGSAETQVRKCLCGETETQEGAPAIGHTFTSISAESKLEKPMATMTVQPSDLKVTGVCETCGETVEITEGVVLENAKLVLGENKITVKYGALSTTLTIQAAELNAILTGVVCDDTYISADKKDDEFTEKEKLGTNVTSFRAYLRTNLSDILANDLFLVNKEQAKVQLTLAITDGRVTDETTFTLKAYAPVAGITDVDFTELTWNNVDNKKDSTGAYSQLHWHNGTALVSDGVGHNVSVENNNIVITLGYSQIADYIDTNGNILFAFATNTTGLKVASVENKDEVSRPALQVLLNDEHCHTYDQEVVQSKYMVSANCKEKATYYLSCLCGEAGTETFTHGGVIDHTFGKAVPEKANTCTEAGVKEHYRCKKCGKYFLYRDGKMKLVTADDVKLSAGHDYKEIPAKETSCTDAGNQKYYKCARCGKYFDAQKKETTKEAQKIQKLEHTYSDPIPEKTKTCTEDGVKAHYECKVCGKTFLEKNGSLVAVKSEDLKLSAGHDIKVIGATKADCTKSGYNKYYQCMDCGKYFTDKAGTIETTKEAQKIPALGHSYTSISAVSNLSNPMATMVVSASDLTVTGTCGRCNDSFAITEGIALEGTTLALGENVITVKYGTLSTTVTIVATELNVTLDGTVTADTYVYSSGKGNEYTEKNEIGTYSSSYRAYFRVNVKDILSNALFTANQGTAKLQLILSVTSGSIQDTTNYTLKTYAPVTGVTDVDFTALTWNSVDNKEGSVGTYSQLNWNNGVQLAPAVAVSGSKITLEFTYDQLKNYIDQNGNILFAFATNTSGLKVGSVENATTTVRPAFKAVISG